MTEPQPDTGLIQYKDDGMLVDRFWSKVDKGGPLPKWAPFLGGCWLWTGSTNRDGYGTFWVRDKHVKAHRFVHELLVGPIPDGLQIDHICRVRHCVRPAHLEAVTQQENVMRGIGPTAENARKSRCPLGHEFTPDNTYVNSRGSRECRTCERDRSALRRAEQRASGLPPGDPKHGTLNGYANWRCRCPLCKSTMSAYLRGRRASNTHEETTNP